MCSSDLPRFAVMSDESAASVLRQRLQTKGMITRVLSGESGLLQVVANDEVDCVVAAIVGAAGLIPSLAAAKAGKRVLLANKEALVMSGKLFMDTARENDAVLLPVDSEHNAIFQSLPDCLTEYHSSVKMTNQRAQAGIERVWLTASGEIGRAHV